MSINCGDLTFDTIMTNASLHQSYRKSLIETIGPSCLWPTAIRLTIFGARHLKHRESFIVVVFCLCNGVDTELLHQWFEECYQFDAAAWRHRRWLIGTYPTSVWVQWNVHQGRTL